MILNSLIDILVIRFGDASLQPVIIGIVLSSILLVWFAGRFSVDEKPYPGIPSVGKDNTVKTDWQAKQLWIVSAKSLIYDSLDKIKRPFQLVAVTGRVIILPGHYMDEIRNDDRATFRAWLKKYFFVNYPGFEGFRPAVDNDVMSNSVKGGLVPALPRITSILATEAEVAFAELYPLSALWQETCFDLDALKMTARLSCRVFLPEPLCYDKDYLRISVEYAEDFIAAVMALRCWSPILRPFVHWFMPETRKLREDVRLARALIEPEVIRRRKKQEEGRLDEKPIDALQWLQASAESRKLPYNPVEGQLNYTLAAIHNTSVTMSNLLYDIVSRPEYIGPLREKISTVLESEGGKWTKKGLNELKLMDSIMKESQRMSPLSLIPVHRLAEKDMSLSDGTFIPKGATFGVPNTQMQDSEVYEEPLKFDGYRFYHMRLQPGEEFKWQFVTTNNDHISFGHGKHACPGRFFACDLIKIIVAQLLHRYDLKLPEGQGRPKTTLFGADRVSNFQSKIYFRERTV